MVIIDREKCIGCGLCEQDCNSSIIRMENGKATVLGPCFECGHCICVCPANAVSMEGYNMDEAQPAGSALDPDALMTAIKNRRSIRQFKDIPVEQEKLDMILEAARFAPSSSNAQDVNFIVLREKLDDVTKVALSELRKLGEEWLKVEHPNFLQKRYALRFSNMETQYAEGKDTLFYHAPAVVIFTGQNQINPSLAAANAELMANALGLGALYVGIFGMVADTPAVRQAIGLDEDRQVVCVLALGHPNVRYLRTTPRKAREIKYL